jgi:hypothetical protein
MAPELVEKLAGKLDTNKENIIIGNGFQMKLFDY